MSGLNLALNVRVLHVDDDGVPTGQAVGILNPVKLAINTPEPDRTQRVSKKRDGYGNALDEIVTPKPTEIALSTDDTGDAEVLAWAVNGEAIGFTQAATTVTDQVVAVTKGQWRRLNHLSLSNVVVKNTAGTVTYQANTDFLVDPVSGWIKPTEARPIANGRVKASHPAAALSGKRVRVGTRAKIQVRIEGDGVNRANGKPVRVVVPKTSLSASGEMDFMGDDFLVTELSGTALQLPGQDPAYIDLLDS